MNYIIDFIDTLTIGEINAYCSGADITIIKQFEAFGNVFLCSSATEPAADPLIDSIVLDDDGGIQLLGEMTLVDYVDTKQFNINDEKNWWKTASVNKLDFSIDNADIPIRGVHSTVYILDSGIDVDHPEFANTDISLLHSVAGDFTDTKGHGTVIASLIAGETCSLTGAKLKIIKLFNDSAPTLQSDLLAGFDAVIADYLGTGRSPSVVNCSWSIPFNEYINTKIQYLIDLGVFVVAAAGNSGEPITNVTPASMPDVLTIGSYSQSLEPSDFSNYTDPSIISFTNDTLNHGVLDGWGPGEQIWGAVAGGGYGFAAGTSCAAAIASGAFAYNFSMYQNTDGATNGEFLSHESGEEVKKIIALGKFDLLDLDDPAYSSSENKLVTYRSGIFTKMPPFFKLNVTANETVHHILFSNFDTAWLEYDGELPSWMQIQESGIVTFDQPPMPSNNSPYSEQLLFTFTLHQRDNSTSTTILNVTVTRDTLTMENVEELLPAGDPLLEEILLGPACSGGSCVDDCGGFPYSCIYLNKTIGCSCVFSDERLKDVKGNIENALDKVMTLNGVLYTQNTKAEEYGFNDYGMQAGLLAQEVQKVLPEVVVPAPFDIDERGRSKSGENYMTVQYEKMVPLLIEAIKELSEEVNRLKKL